MVLRPVVCCCPHFPSDSFPYSEKILWRRARTLPPEYVFREDSVWCRTCGASAMGVTGCDAREMASEAGVGWSRNLPTCRDGVPFHRRAERNLQTTEAQRRSGNDFPERKKPDKPSSWQNVATCSSRAARPALGPVLGMHG